VSKINKKIQESAPEVIRDQLCSVLALEIALQADGYENNGAYSGAGYSGSSYSGMDKHPDNFEGDPDLKVLDPTKPESQPPEYVNIKVWCEKFTPFQASDLDTVLVTLKSIRYTDEIQGCSNGELTFFISVFCNDENDSQSKLKLHKLIRYIKGILNHEAYLTLGFVKEGNNPPPVQGIKVSEVDIETELTPQTDNITMSSLQCEIKFIDKYNDRQLLAVQGVDTTTKNIDPERGIYYSNNF
jgi:hypothetical protein